MRSSGTEPLSHHDTEADPQFTRKWLVFATVGIGSLMSSIDNSVVNLALPSLRDVFHVDLGQVEWVVLTYLLINTSLVLTFGRLADMVGRTRLYNLGFIIFTVASALCGAAPGLIPLVAFRGIQAIGASMITCSATAILLDAFPRRQRGQVMGLQGATFAAGNMIGPSLGGFLLTFLGWRSIFLINVPIGIVGMIFAFRFLPRQYGQRGVRFDLPGSILVGLAIAFLLLALNQGQELGLVNSVIVLGCLAIVAGAAFIVRELRAEAPLLRLSILRTAGLSNALLAQAMSTMAYASNLFLLPFFLVSIQGRPAAQAGLILLAASLTSSIMSPVGGWLADRVDPRFVSSTGLSIMLIAFFLYSGVDASWTPFDMVIRLVLMSIGSGLFNSPNASSAYRYVHPADRGLVAGTMSFVRNGAYTSGTAIAASIWTIRRAADSQSLNLPVTSSQAGIAGLHDTFIFVAALILVALVASLMKPKGGDDSGTGEVIPAAVELPAAPPA